LLNALSSVDLLAVYHRYIDRQDDGRSVPLPAACHHSRQLQDEYRASLDVVPAERRCMGEPCIGPRLFSRTEMGDGVGDVGGVPEHDCGDDEVEAGGTKLLRLGTAVGNPALFAGRV
jgi:hypothetical protein